MLKEYLYTCLILGLVYSNTYALPNGTLCMDCTERNRECTIQQTGYSVIKQTDNSLRKIRRGLLYVPVANCLPMGMQINATTFEALCVWSPKLGCQVMIHKFRKMQMFCNDCIPPFEPLNDGVTRCPCHGFRLIDSGSGDLHSGPLKFLIAFHLVQRLMLE
ncbi:uncharacterized protein [Drosophila kikkawai]|uniref:Uncharacterized protein n=1 Tax=Drosophila kikkawai TaxID=30033 RepID=A0A6P4IFD3_DROKI|nr:uncharacterized protein LOC108074137 [Drosophila kikkawai]